MKQSLDFQHNLISQSYIFTILRYNFSIYEKRILYRLIEIAQAETEGIKLCENLRQIHKPQEDREIELAIKSILVPGDKGSRNQNYRLVTAACNSLCSKTLQYIDETGKIIIDPIIYHVNITPGSLNFTVADWVWSAILDLSKGYRSYDIAIAMRLRSPYAMRFFEILAGQEKPITLSVSFLREIFYVECKYKQTKDFEKRILVASQKELDRISPYSFIFEPGFVGKKIASYTFFRTENKRNKNELLDEMYTKKSTNSLKINLSVYDYLKYSCDFNDDEIRKNTQTLLEGQKNIPNFLYFLSTVRPNANRKRSPKAYIIGTIKKRLNLNNSKQNKKNTNYDPSSSPLPIVSQLAEKFRAFKNGH